MGGYKSCISALTPGDLAAVALDVGFAEGVAYALTRTFAKANAWHGLAIEVTRHTNVYVLTWNPFTGHGPYGTREAAVAAALAEHDPGDEEEEEEARARTAVYTSAFGRIIKFDKEDDGRFIARIPDLPGCMVYGDTMLEAFVLVQFLEERIILDRKAHGED
jgi:hypothetical protein